ncbi:MAG: N-acyl homoserine lactonase family protein [Gammaproteobacteria bacterium]
MSADPTPDTSIRRLFILLCGFEILPKTVSTKGVGGRFILSEPVCAYLLDTDRGWVLLDAGLNPDNGRDRGRMDAKFWSLGMTPPVIRDAHLLERQLAAIGVTCADIGHVILSHLHYDHCGALRLFAHARVSIQRREYEHAFGPDPGMAYFRDEYDDPRLRWELHDGDWEAQPGLRLLDTRGHTQGHQSAVVELPQDGTLVLPFDAGDLAENFDAEILPGESCDDEAAMRAIRRIKSLVSETGATCLLFHDPVAIQTLRLCPDFYR